ncbi:hypothetical protein KAU45_06480 [bacterium]|nr:hypothetical protein [bacterium]
MPGEAVYEYNRLILFSSKPPEGDEGRQVALEALVRLLYFNPPEEGLNEYLQKILDPENYKDALYILGGIFREYGDYAGALEVYDLLYSHAPDVRTNLILLFALAETNELVAPISPDAYTDIVVHGTLEEVKELLVLKTTTMDRATFGFNGAAAFGEPELVAEAQYMAAQVFEEYATML